LFLGKKLEDTLDMAHWAEEWDNALKDYKLIQRQIQDIRRITLKRLRDNSLDKSYSQHLDYTVALLMQSLLFITYSSDAIQTLRCWLAACLAATLIEQFFADEMNKVVRQDIGLR
jgi:hypothetical protein